MSKKEIPLQAQIEAGHETEAVWKTTATTYQWEIRCDGKVTHKVMEKFGRMQRNMFRLWKCCNIKHKQLFIPRVPLGIRAAGSGWPGGKHCSDSLSASAGLRKHTDFTTTSDFPKFYLLTLTRKALEDCHINICFERKHKKEATQDNPNKLLNPPT